MTAIRSSPFSSVATHHPIEKVRGVSGVLRGGKTRLLVMVLVTAAVLGGCSGDAALKGTWVATEASPTALMAGSRVALTFSNGGVNGVSGCNPIGATKASISGGRLTISPLGTGLKACGEDLGKQEMWLAELLQSSPNVTIDGSVMVLEGSVGKLRLQKA